LNSAELRCGNPHWIGATHEAYAGIVKPISFDAAVSNRSR
jgi:hypothetical protein